MKVYNWPVDKTFENQKIAILGSFETLHLGHYELFKIAKNLKAQNPEKEIVCFLFDNKHQQKAKMFQIKTRLYTLYNIGIDEAVIIHFDQDFRNLSAQTFIDKLKAMNVSDIVCGQDFRFGFNRLGNVDALKANFNCQIASLKKINGMKIASSTIRQIIEDGSIELLNTLLIEKYAFIIELNTDDYSFEWPNNLEKIHAGTYLANVVIENVEYHAIVKIGLEKNEIVFLDLKKQYLPKVETFVEILKQLRFINHMADDKVFKDEIKQAFKFFSIM
ncbi:FAD synthase [Mycoplasma sp. 128]